MSEEERPASNASMAVDLDQEVRDAQLLVAYASETGLEIEPETVDRLVESKYVAREGRWTQEAEVTFWEAFNRMSVAIRPVTLGSLKAVRPAPGKRWSPADRAVTRYRLIAIFSLALLLAAQVYSFIGASAIKSFDRLSAKEEELRDQIETVKKLRHANDLPGDPRDPDYEKLTHKLHHVEQQRDANLDIIKGWNKLWLFVTFKDKLRGKLRPDRRVEYEDEMEHYDDEIRRLEALVPEGAADRAARAERVEELRDKLWKVENDRDLAPMKNELFLIELTAEFALRMFQVYLLPLLYGLLGSVLFVLRGLAHEIEAMTYSKASETNFRLRLTLGALAGLAIGWFLTPDERGQISVLSSIALPFLAGYNVELLFSVMDRVIENLTKSKDGEKVGAE